MAQQDRDVKSDPGHRRSNTALVLSRCLAFCDEHPRVGWYIAAMTTLNTVLNLVQVFH